MLETKQEVVKIDLFWIKMFKLKRYQNKNKSKNKNKNIHKINLVDIRNIKMIKAKDPKRQVI